MSEAMISVSAVREIFTRCLNLHYDQRAYSWHEIQDTLDEVRKAASESTDYAVSLRKFIEALPCPDPRCSDGSIISTGPDPQNDACEWCYMRHMLLNESQSGHEIVHPQPGPIVDAAGLVGANTFTFSEPVDSSGGPIGADVAARQWRENAVGTTFEGLAHYVPPSYSRILWRGAYLDLPSMQVPSQWHADPADHLDAMRWQKLCGLMAYGDFVIHEVPDNAEVVEFDYIHELEAAVDAADALHAKFGHESDERQVAERRTAQSVPQEPKP